jgi:hypothetical protein
VHRPPDRLVGVAKGHPRRTRESAWSVAVAYPSRTAPQVPSPMAATAGTMSAKARAQTTTVPTVSNKSSRCRAMPRRLARGSLRRRG